MKKNPVQVAKRLSGKTGEQLAELAGVSPGYLSRMSNGKRTITTRFLDQLAGALDMSTEQFYRHLSDTPPDEPTKTKATGRQITNPLKPFTVPIFGSLTGGGEDYLEVTDEYLEQIPAPASLMEVQGSYALYMPGNTMEPRYLEGEPLFVNPKKPPIPGDYAAIQHLSVSDEKELLVVQVVRYEGIENGKRVFSRHNGQNLKIATEKMRAMHKIIATGEW